MRSRTEESRLAATTAAVDLDRRTQGVSSESSRTEEKGNSLLDTQVENTDNISRISVSKRSISKRVISLLQEPISFHRQKVIVEADCFSLKSPIRDGFEFVP